MPKFYDVLHLDLFGFACRMQHGCKKKRQSFVVKILQIRTDFISLLVLLNNYKCTIGNRRTLLHRRRQTLRVHSPGGSTLLREMTSWPRSEKYIIRTPYLLQEHSYQISSRFDLKRRSLGCVWRASSQEKKKKKNNNNNNNNKDIA